MQRAIKFRAWDDSNKKMYSVGEISFNSAGEIDNICICDDTWEWTEPEDVKLMEYTGFKDADEKEIYEGDIIQFEWEEDSCWGEAGLYLGLIKYDEGVFGINYINRKEIRKYPDGSWCKNNEFDDIRAFMSWTYDDCIIVVGNIYENPELLLGK